MRNFHEELRNAFGEKRDWKDWYTLDRDSDNGKGLEALLQFIQ